MNPIERPTERRAGLPPYLKAAFLLLAAAALPGAAQAQWSTSGSTTSTTNNVGVGTSAPAAKLDVASPYAAPAYYGSGQLVVRSTDAAAANKGGTIELGGFYYNTSNYSMFAALKGGYEGGTNAGYLSLFTEPNEGELTERMRITSAGNFGIGTADPSLGGLVASKFTVTAADDSTALAAGSSSFPRFALNNHSNGSWTMYDYGGGSWHAGVTQLAGNVGVGTTNPTHTLEVAGTINASGAITGGSINATYQDVAEWVPSSQKLSAGTVVVLDTSLTNHVLASAKPYDTRVAGVVSDNPGVILGQGGDGKVKVATTGRVKVKVDATRAPIQVGDLLVTSDREGVAMKSVPVDLGGTQIHRPGTIIGKALEPLEKGTGEILVLLSLQ